MMSVALEKTDRIKVGPFVTVPTGARYHPAIVAQAAATLDNMYPGRFLLGVGTGEALNERPFWNGEWPEWKERMGRLVEGVKLMRMMWESKRPFEFEGKYFSSDFFYLYTKPRTKIPLYFSGIGRRAAYFAGIYADKLVTLAPRNNPERLKNTILPAYWRGRKKAGKSGRGGAVAELAFSMEKPEQVLRKHWRSLGYLRKNSWSIPNPVVAEKEGRKTTLNQVQRNIHFCRNWRELIGIIEEYVEVGITEVALVTSANKKLIRSYAENVLNVF